MKSDKKIKVVVNYGDRSSQPRTIDSENKPIYDVSFTTGYEESIDVDTLIISLKNIYDHNPESEEVKSVIIESFTLELCRQFCIALKKAGMGRTFVPQIKQTIDPLVKKLVEEEDTNIAITTRDLLIHTVTSVCVINGYTNLDLSGFVSVIHKFMCYFKIIG